MHAVSLSLGDRRDRRAGGGEQPHAAANAGLLQGAQPVDAKARGENAAGLLEGTRIPDE